MEASEQRQIPVQGVEAGDSAMEIAAETAPEAAPETLTTQAKEEVKAEPQDASMDGEAHAAHQGTDGPTGAATNAAHTDAADAPTPRPEALYLLGVNDLSQKQVTDFVSAFSRSPFAIEWINDESLAVVFDKPSVALGVLRSLVDGDVTDPRELHSTKPHPDLSCNFRVRLATTRDVKPHNSKELSRYYLLHGAPSRQENIVRFGAGRAEPMKYGGGDLLKKNRRKQQSADLFPHLSKGPADDLFPHLAGGGGGDLFPHLAKGPQGGIKKRSRGRGRGRRGGASASGADKMDVDREVKEKEAKPFENMDY